MVAVAPVPILIPSPLVGPSTWSPVAAEFRRRGVDTLVPALDDDGDGGRGLPFWRQHADAVIRAVALIPPDVPVALVAHSGAGPLLPAIGKEIGHQIAAYAFVDAGIPADGKSRLALMEAEDSGFASNLRQHLATGERFPAWTEANLAPVLPDARVRHQLVGELRPRPLSFFTEPIPVFAGWPDAPCVFLQFSPAYDGPARRAREEGWRIREIAAGHFHMLVDPAAVVDALLTLIGHPASGV